MDSFEVRLFNAWVESRYDETWLPPGQALCMRVAEERSPLSIPGFVGFLNDQFARPKPDLRKSEEVGLIFDSEPRPNFRLSASGNGVEYRMLCAKSDKDWIVDFAIMRGTDIA